MVHAWWSMGDVLSPGLYSPERVVNAWKETPVKWYPIPALLGAVVLVGIKARRDYVSDRNGSRGKVVDENGQVVTASGPWTVGERGAWD